MSHPPDDVEWTTAVAIVNNALAAAIDHALEADVSSECFAAAVLHHVCTALVEHFEQSPDDVARLARKSASAYVGACEAMPLKH
jgi:hypothetical protein